MSTIQTIPFSKLVASDAINARSATKDGLDELAASIAAKGLIQALAVRPTDGGKWEVIDGRRRYQAIAKLVKAKTWKRDTEIPVLVRNEDDGEALETSLMANTVRLPMHPVDQHAVFARLIDQGAATADVATRFGIAERTVKQHLALGRLAPEVRDAWRKGKIDAKAAQAFTMTTDQTLQAEVLSRAVKQKHYGTDGLMHAVRRELTSDALTADSNEFKFIGVDAYAAAGGTFTENLFEDERYVADVGLLKRLTREKIEAKCAEFLADGWAWAEPEEAQPKHWGQRPESLLDDDPEPVYTPAETARLAELRRSNNDAADIEIEIIETAATLRAYTPEQKAASGVIVGVGWHGAFEIQYGMVKAPGGAPRSQAVDADEEEFDPETGEILEDDDAGDTESAPGGNDVDADADDDDTGPEQNDAFSITNALLETVTTAQTTAVAEALRTAPEIALRVTVAALTSESWDCPAKISIQSTTGFARGVRAEFAQRLRELMAMSDEDVLSELAAAAATSIDCVLHNSAARCDGTRTLVNALPDQAYLDAAREQFLAEDYFKRAPKAAAIAALEEMEEAGAIRSLSADLGEAKKADLAGMAAREARACGWLPPELRHTAYALIVQDAGEPGGVVAA